MSELSDIVYVNSGPAMAASITSAGAVYVWGSNYAGMMGQGNKVDYSSPVLYPLPTNVRAVKVEFGYYHLCVLTTDGSLYCSGEGRDLLFLHNIAIRHVSKLSKIRLLRT